MKVEVSNGDIVDRLTILLIKKEKIKDQNKLENIQREIDAIADVSDSIIPRESTQFIRLYNINKVLWNIEDSIREKERKSEFDDEFIQIARSVYFTNDERAEAKREINNLSASHIVEEKLYETY